jgi:hypothetical protein
MSTAAWEYDAEQGELALKYRIPLVHTSHPSWNYLVSVCVWDLYRAQRPTDDEARMIGSFIDYQRSRYRAHWQEKLRTRPFDMDGGFNSLTLIKHANGGWGYRRRTWEYGPMFVPSWEDDPESLEAVLDRIYTYGDHLMGDWAQWKVDHPEVFGGAS